jgi:hypothetical protein
MYLGLGIVTLDLTGTRRGTYYFGTERDSTVVPQ